MRINDPRVTFEMFFNKVKEHPHIAKNILEKEGIELIMGFMVDGLVLFDFKPPLKTIKGKLAYLYYKL